MSRNVAVLAGSTGLTGRYLREVLEEDAFYDGVQALTRQDRLESLEASQLPGATHLFCCLGTTIKAAGSKAALRQVDFDYVVRFAKAGREAGATRLMVVSSVGANARSGTFYLKVKGEMEEALAGMGFEALHIFRPGVLMGSRPDARPRELWGIRLLRAVEWAMGGSLRKYRPMPVGVLASAMAVAGERGATGQHIHHFDEIYGLAGGGAW
ncbi:Rossmann-fold NAD(P)-binding domain-containing protein [Paludibaculum fermentans]|uniref:Oxidoreductase n=1 Tax=Paludibaculum fermentans TaxID=1473598 RepID=A0A7S7NWC7_PALFE|nr:oxidoreductase [Paludibaculum fermentans]QOY90404.1 oxidoreductase [Paludibaculum fermentans]